MTSEEMKNEVLSRAASLDRARNKRIKATAATLACAAVICAAAIPIYKANQNAGVSPQAQTTRQSAETKTAGNNGGASVRVTISAPTAETEPSTAHSVASNVSPYEKKTTRSSVKPSASSENKTTESGTKKNESSTRKNAPQSETTEASDERKDSDPKQTDKTSTSANGTAGGMTTEKQTTVTKPSPTKKPAHVNKPNSDSTTGSATMPTTTNPDNDASAYVQTIDSIVDNTWSFKIQNATSDGESISLKMPASSAVSGNIVLDGKSYTFYAESYPRILPDGEYIDSASDLDSAECLDGYSVYRFSGIDGVGDDMLLVTNGHRSFIFSAER